jgi:GTP-binding protein Era
MTTRCGYVALLGRPNAGKSTLLNAFIGDKLAVVSRKPQTTRNRILGIALEGDAQMLFLDTPGIHKSQGTHLINSRMNRVANATAAEADVIVYLADLSIGFGPEDAKNLAQVLNATAGANVPWMTLATKSDKMKRHEFNARLITFEAAVDAALEGKFADRRIGGGTWLFSAKNPEQVRELRKYLAGQLPEGVWLFPEDDLTDMPETFLVSELIREQAFRQLGEEIPYGTAVRVERIERKPDMTVVDAILVVNRKSHKPIVIGAGGRQIKELGQAARESLERHFGTKVFLDLNVQIAESWVDDQEMIARFQQLEEPTIT